MKYIWNGLMRKIHGRELNIKNAKNLTKHYGSILKEKALIPSIIGGIALAAGAAIAFMIPKKNSKIQKKNDESREAPQIVRSKKRAAISRIFDAVAVVSTLSSIVSAVTRQVKK